MAALLAALLFGGAPSAALPPTDPTAAVPPSAVDVELVDRGPSSSRPLAPGDTITWPIGVTSDAVALADLRVVVKSQASPDLADRFLVSLHGCRERWRQDHCASGAFEISPPRTLSAWQDRSTTVSDSAGMIPASVEVLAEVGLAPDAPDSVQGQQATVRIGFSATGLDCLGDCSAAVVPEPGPGTDLPTTGFPLGLSLLFGVATVLAGIGLARWGSVRWR